MFSLFRKAYEPSLARLGVEHSDDCAALHAACFAFPWPQTEFEALLLAPTAHGEGAFGRANEMQGFILSRLAADEAEILTIAVAPRRRGAGVAARLMKANMNRVIVAGAKTWFLEVEAENTAALALYRKFGFEQVGERKAYYRTESGGNARALILRRSLR